MRRLCNAFYDNMERLPEAETIRRMHGADTGPVREKLFEYLSGWLGGPKLYRRNTAPWPWARRTSPSPSARRSATSGCSA
ncbi:hypothetical protein ACFSHR_24470 [Azotobacter chroococcum]